MATPSDWIWITLTQAQLDLARRATDLALKNVKDNNLGEGRFIHRWGDGFAKRIGYEGEIAFRLIGGWPLPSAEELASTFHRPDVGSYAVKTRSKINCELDFDDRHLEQRGCSAFALLYDPSPSVALIGTLDKQKAREVSVPKVKNGKPCFSVAQEFLVPWPRDRSCWTCADQQIGGDTFLGLCRWFERRGGAKKPITPAVVDAGCRYWRQRHEGPADSHE